MAACCGNADDYTDFEELMDAYRLLLDELREAELLAPTPKENNRKLKASVEPYRKWT